MATNSASTSSPASGTNDFAVARYNADGSLDAEFNDNAVNTLGGTAAYIENADAVALESAVAIHGAKLATLASGAGNYDGSSVTLTRGGRRGRATGLRRHP